jgi:hypothetical protein
MTIYGPYDPTYGPYAYITKQDMEGGIFLEIDTEDSSWPLYFYIDSISILEDCFLIVKSVSLYSCPLFLSCIIQLKRKKK